MSPIANQNIAKLHHYDNPRLNTEFERIYNFLQFTKYPRESIDGEALKKGSVHETKLIQPLSAEAAPGSGVVRTDAEIIALIEANAFFLHEYAQVIDEKPDGTPGGTFVSGAWRTRDINTEIQDNDNLLTVAANQITLIAGTYYTRIKAPALRVQSNIIRLYNFTDGVVVLLGTNEYSEATPVGSHSSSVISGVFTIAAPKVLEIQHHCFLTRTLHGFGGSVLTSAPQPVEVYTVAEFWRTET